MDHVLGHGGFANVDAQLQKFAMDPWCAPARIGQADFSDEVANLAGFTGPALADLTLPGPVKAESLAVPRNHGAG